MAPIKSEFKVVARRMVTGCDYTAIKMLNGPDDYTKARNLMARTASRLEGFTITADQLRIISITKED